MQLFFVDFEVLHVDGFLKLCSLSNRRFFEGLSASEFAYDSGLLEFAFEFLQRFFNVFAFFNRYYNHN